MCFIEHNYAILAHVFVDEGLSEEHTVSHVLDNGVWASAILESDSVTNFFAQLNAHFFRNSFGY